MRCFVCNSNEWIPLYKDIEKCSGCDFVKAIDKHFKQDFANTYDRTYYNKGEYLDYAREKKAHENNFKNRVKRIRKYKRKGKLLEIGSAYGFFLKEAKKHYNPTIGIDLNKEICEIASKISSSKIIAGEFLNIKFRKNSFDVICLFDTIEHLTNVDKYINKIRSILKPKGILVIETGDIESLMARYRKNKWRLINPEIHLTYFSKMKLTQLLENSGFKILEIKRLGHQRTLAQIIFRTMGTTKLILPFMYNITTNINLYDTIFVIAQKK